MINGRKTVGSDKREPLTHELVWLWVGGKAETGRSGTALCGRWGGHRRCRLAAGDTLLLTAIATAVAIRAVAVAATSLGIIEDSV